jgi:hypothetical protein
MTPVTPAGPAHLTRRATLAAALAIAAGGRVARAQTDQSARERQDAWFRNAVQQIQASAPVGGPSAGAIDHSMFGVEAPRAGRIHPSTTPPALSEFYVRAILEVDAVERADWDVGIVWRINWEMDGLWWTIENDGHWTFSRTIWALSTRDTEELHAGELCDDIASPLMLQALVVGSHLAVSVNEGPVTVVPIPAEREPGHVGILANAREEHLRPNGVTPYRELALWSLDGADVSDNEWKEWKNPC